MSWEDNTRSALQILMAELAHAQSVAAEYNLDPEKVYRKIFEKIDRIYTEDMPVARARDRSDLLIYVRGEAVEHDPRVSLLSGIFNNVKNQVRDITKAISGLRREHKLTARDIDLSLSGIAQGSLYIGFSVPIPGTEESTRSTIFQEEDDIYRASKAALQTINNVAHFVSDEGEDFDEINEIQDVVDDPKVRDTALIAVQRLAPSGRSEYESISVTGSGDIRRPARLTKTNRAIIREVLRKPVLGTEELVVEGVIREVDLDANRFEVRRISDEQIQDIRCVYKEISGKRAREIIDQRVRVTGIVEKRADEVPRLMEVTKIESID